MRNPRNENEGTDRQGVVGVDRAHRSEVLGQVLVDGERIDVSRRE